MAKTMWGGRFKKDTFKTMETFNASIDFDKRLYACDIKGSIAHAKMLAKCGIISKSDAAKIEKGLNKILADISKGNFVFKKELEDIHMNIEAELTKRIGNAGARLHTARSRNDQVATDMHLYVKEEILILRPMILDLMQSVLNLAQNNFAIIFPAMTHLQHAQPIRFPQHALAYFFMFNRDLERLDFVYKHTDFCPLGAGAVAGTTFKIDRQFSAKLLGFKNIYLNSMDAVSDRDYILEFLTFGTILSMHLSRFCEEIILWASSEFSFVEIDDAFATGSSMMPQKKNPDAAELIRGKTGRIFGHLLALLCVLKGLPLAYNKDLQEDKEGLFDTIDTLKISLSVFCKMLDTLKLNKEGIENSFKKDYSNATDLADYLVKKGLPFRKAHEISGSAVALALKENKTLQELPLPVLQKLSPLFEGDIFKTLEIENCADSRNSFGAGGAKQVKMQIAKAKEIIKKARKNKSNM